MQHMLFQFSFPSNRTHLTSHETQDYTSGVQDPMCSVKKFTGHKQNSLDTARFGHVSKIQRVQ